MTGQHLLLIKWDWGRFCSMTHTHLHIRCSHQKGKKAANFRKSGSTGENSTFTFLCRTYTVNGCCLLPLKGRRPLSGNQWKKYLVR
jgi:hypothetical protein